MKTSIAGWRQDEEVFIDEGCFILEIANGSDDPQLSVARARVLPGVTTHWHRLRDTTERYLVLQGQGVAEVGDAAPRTVGPGDMVLIPPGIRQRITNRGDTELVFLALCTPRFTFNNYERLEDR